MPRGTPGTEPAREQLVSMILGTFREMPGLTVHPIQAARFFGLRTETCEVVFGDLTASGRLRRGADGQFAWAGDDVDRRKSVLPPQVPSARNVARRGR